MSRIRLVIGIVIAAFVLATSATTAANAATASTAPPRTTTTHAVKPSTLPSCEYKGLIKSDIGHYLSDFGTMTGLGMWGGYNPSTDYGEGIPWNGYDYAMAVTSQGSADTWCVQQATGEGHLGSGGYFILPVSGGGSLCLDAAGESTTSLPWIWGCNGTSTQVFCWNGNGYIPLASEKSIALKDGPTSYSDQNFVTENQGLASKWTTVQTSLDPSTNCPS